ncbi:dTDP-4-dehydrorhamnose 3,5-epimerase [Nitrospira sp. SCGC AG-212-E16]|nr:dTDP-4-dehydrorhamnose 3,5-epimerase [Nitrospira sp. SCGC AG-212-E16]
MPFEFVPLEIPGLTLIKPRIFGDNRGFFLELYKYTDFSKAGIEGHLVQDNYSRSTKGTLRGLHYQKSPKAQGKLVSCVNGRIYDVAVDIRKGSPYYGKWSGVELTEENKYLLYVPPGFAHGFQVMSETAEVMYKCTEEYSPENDRGILWNDPDINVVWPVQNPLLSEKGKRHPLLTDADNNFEVNGQE